MRGRSQTGVAAAGVSLTAAVFVQGCPVLAAAFVGLTLLILVGTFADRLWLLHNIPIIGAPKPKVTFRVNGSVDPVVRLRRAREGELKRQPRRAEIQVGVENPARERIDRALINFLLPIGLLRRKTDGSGHTDEQRGRWMEPTDEPIGEHEGPYDYWAEDHMDFPARSTQQLHFSATFEEPGEYAIRLRISAPALYEADYDSDAVLRVEAVDEDGPLERLTDLIAQGEELRRDLPDMPDDRRPRSVAGFVFAAHQLVEAEHPKGVSMLRAAAAYEGSKAGVDYYLAVVDSDLVALYGIRRQLARRKDAAQ